MLKLHDNMLEGQTTKVPCCATSWQSGLQLEMEDICSMSMDDDACFC